VLCVGTFFCSGLTDLSPHFRIERPSLKLGRGRGWVSTRSSVDVWTSPVHHHIFCTVQLAPPWIRRGTTIQFLNRRTWRIC